jgi:hypothetical protein
MSLGAEELNWRESSRRNVQFQNNARKELNCEKKTLYVIRSESEAVINPLPGESSED